MYAFAVCIVHVHGKEGNSGDLALFKLDLPHCLTKADSWLSIFLKSALLYCLFV